MGIANLRAKELEYCKDHPVYFVETYGHIEDRNKAEIIQPLRSLPLNRRSGMQDRVLPRKSRF